MPVIIKVDLVQSSTRPCLTSKSMSYEVTKQAISHPTSMALQSHLNQPVAFVSLHTNLHSGDTNNRSLMVSFLPLADDNLQ